MWCSTISLKISCTWKVVLKFSKTFSLAEYTEPTDATMENGILTITLKQELPEEKKPKTIKICLFSLFPPLH